MEKIQSLNGEWMFITDPNEQGENLGHTKRDCDESNFKNIEVPGYWRSYGVDYDGVAWYRKKFSVPSEDTNARLFIRFGGVNYACRVWVNGQFAGGHEGSFDPFYIDISDYWQVKESNVLVVRVSSPIDKNPEWKGHIRGASATWDCIPIRQGHPPNPLEEQGEHYPYPAQSPGGIHGDVSLVFYKKLRLKMIRVTPKLKKEDFAHLKEVPVDVSLSVENLENHSLHTWVDLQMAPIGFEWPDVYERCLCLLESGETQKLNFTLKLPRPRLWWCWDLGVPNLYILNVQVGIEDENQPTGKKQIRFGVRKFWQDEKLRFYLNGKRLFLKGCNYLSRLDPAQVNREFYKKDIDLMKNAHMNTIRCFANIERSEFYRLCDEEGMLIYQDLPFQWGYTDDKKFLAKALHYSDRLLDQLHNHPGLVIWCCHSEPRPWDWQRLNKAIFNQTCQREPDRVVIRASIFAPPKHEESEATEPETYDILRQKYITVPWKGWYDGEVEDIENISPAFISEFGAQALPRAESLKKIVGKETLWPPDLDVWRYHDFQVDIHSKQIGEVGDYKNLENFIKKSQNYQARLCKIQLESLRRRKYKPVAGVLQFLFADCWPAITWSVLDYYRKPKEGYFAVCKAFRPVLLTVTARMQSEQGKSSSLKLKMRKLIIKIHIVNDLRKTIQEAMLRVEVESPRIKTRNVIKSSCQIPADTSVVLHSISLGVQLDEELRVREKLSNSTGRVIAKNTHRIRILDTKCLIE